MPSDKMVAAAQITKIAVNVATNSRFNVNCILYIPYLGCLSTRSLPALERAETQMI